MVSLEAFYLTASTGRDRVICVCSRNQLMDEELCLCLRMLVALSLAEIRAFS